MSDKQNSILMTMTNKAAQNLQALQASSNKAEQSYYQKLTEEYKLTPESIAQYAWALYIECNKNEKKEERKFEEFVNQYFYSDKTKENQDAIPMQNYIKYLLSRQMYSVSTIDAGSGMPIVRNILGIYRHGYIQIYDSPFKNGEKKYNENHEILELNPNVQTDEYHSNRVLGRVREVPGIVTMALHLSGQALLKSGQYNLINYRPWVNDCQTYFKHAQEEMNHILKKINPEIGEVLQQKVIEHYRYRPNMTEKKSKWLRRQAGILLKPEENLFSVGEKGLGAKVKLKKIVSDAEISENFRNAVWDRQINESPSKKMLAYSAWLMKQFLFSMIDRAKRQLAYEKSNIFTKGNIKHLIQYLEKQDHFIHEMVNVLLFDFKSMNFKEMILVILSGSYNEIAEQRSSFLKKTLELLALLKELHSDPFNPDLTLKIKTKQEEIGVNLAAIKEAIFNIQSIIKEGNVSMSILHEENLQKAIRDLDKHHEGFNLNINKALEIDFAEGQDPESQPKKKTRNMFFSQGHIVRQNKEAIEEKLDVPTNENEDAKVKKSKFSLVY